MPTNTAPTPPDSLPKYIAEGIPKQDVETLYDLQEYITVLIDYREQPIEESELPEGAEIVENDEEKGVIAKEKVQCGDETCKCVSGSKKDMHGPYLYRYYYNDEGDWTSDYLGKPD